jgi:ribosomal protein S18 acetylase RimI-like enzyme
MEIRPAVEDDAASLTALHLASRRAAYRGLMPDRLLDGAAAEERRARAWQARLATPAADLRVWVAVLDAARSGPRSGPLLGFASSAPARDPDLDPSRTAEVTSLYVDPAHFGRGVGRALLEHTLADLRARGFEEVVLWVLAGNARAERFYALAGLTAGKHEVKVDDGADLPHVRWARRL